MVEIADDFTQRQINDGLYLYKRPRSSRWQARIRRTSNEWFSMSCGSSDFDAAKKIATERQHQLRDAQSSGLVDISRRFSDVAKLTIKHLDAEVDVGLGKVVNRDYKQVIQRYFIPVLGKYQINHIDHKALVELDAFRVKLIGRQPNKSTINTHNAALRRVFKTAVDRGYLLPLQIPQLVNRGRPTRARPYFDRDDYRRVARNLREFAGTGHKGYSKMLRDMMWDYVLILANTGMRTGEEALKLKWNQIKRTREYDETSPNRELIDILKFSVVGKKRPRTLICRDVGGNVSKPLERIQSRFPELKDLSDRELFKRDEYVFRLENGDVPHHERLCKTFKIFLKQNDLLKDTEGQERTLYSLRHTYATTQLRNGVSWDDLAIQMGTSRVMLEKHYSKFKVEDRAADFSGLAVKRRRKAAKQKTELEEARAMIKNLQKTIEGLTKTIERMNVSKV